MKRQLNPTAHVSLESRSEADRFRAFAKRVVSVPKAEIDRRAKIWEKAKDRARKVTA